MKAMALTGIRKMALIDIPEPTITNPTDVLLQILQVGVCGSDVHYYTTGRIGSMVVEFPFVLGHECAARVIEVGSAVQRVKVGDEVAVDPAMPCHQCDQCRAGRENTCRNLRFLGCPGQAAGCLAERIVMPEKCLFPVTDRLSVDEAVISEPLAIGVYAVQQSALAAGHDAAVLGAGPVGLSVLMAARSVRSGQLYATDKIDPRLNAARAAGASWTGNPLREDIVAAILEAQPAGMDVVYECAGQQDTLDQAVDLLKPGGKLMLIGIPEIERVSFVIDKMRRKELSVVNVRRQNQCVDATLELLRRPDIDATFMVTHRFELAQAVEAFDLVASYADGVVKAMIQF